MSSPREHEVAVLGILTAKPDLIPTVQEKLQDHKWGSDTGKTFAIIERLGVDADLLKVSNESKESGGINSTDLSNAFPVDEPDIEGALKTAMDALLDADREQATRAAMLRYLGMVERGGPNSAARDEMLQTIAQLGGDTPIIIAEEGMESVQMALAEAALEKIDPPRLYHHNRMVVRVIRAEATSTEQVKRDTGASIIVPVEPAYVQRVFQEVASWRRLDKRTTGKKRYKVTRCPMVTVNQWMASIGDWNLPYLNGVVTTPTIRPDGTVFQTPGYDKPTGLLATFAPGSFPTIPDKPSRDEAFEALDTLFGVLDEFKFEDELADRSAAVAAILTGLVRLSLPAAPLTAIRAPRARSGKTMLADVVGMIATGHRCATITQPDCPAEWRKLILSILIAGDRVVNIDNVERPLGKTAIVPVLSGETFTERLLSTNKTVTARTNCTQWLATGNGLSVYGDLVQRALLVTLDTRMERPQERTFKRDLYEWVPAHRPELVAAALSIVRAYQAAGCPDTDAKPFAGFEKWGQMARHPLIWLGQPDPCATGLTLSDDDPEASVLSDLLQAWWNMYGTDGRQVTQVLSDLGPSLLEGTDPSKTALREAINAVCEGQATSRRVGDYLRRHKNRSEGGMEFVAAGKYGHTILWAVRTESKATDSCKSLESRSHLSQSLKS